LIGKTACKTAVHDTGPIKALTGGFCSVPLRLPAVPCVTVHAAAAGGRRPIGMTRGGCGA
jgi:hypothetical protein